MTHDHHHDAECGEEAGLAAPQETVLADGPRVITFGCRLNTYESEVMRGHAKAAGMEDVIIFNTCAVTKEAERQAKQAYEIVKILKDKKFFYINENRFDLLDSSLLEISLSYNNISFAEELIKNGINLRILNKYKNRINQIRIQV